MKFSLSVLLLAVDSTRAFSPSAVRSNRGVSKKTWMSSEAVEVTADAPAGKTGAEVETEVHPAAVDDTTSATAAAVEDGLANPVVLNVGPKPPARVKSELPSRDPVREERTSRALLEARLEMGQSARKAADVPDVGPKPSENVKMELPPRDPVREEQVSRALLQARLEIEQAAREAAGVPDVGPKPSEKVKMELPPRDPVREEQVSRALLQARLEIEQAVREAAIVPDVGPKPSEKVKMELPPRDLVREEKTARALLETRLQIEEVARLKAAAERKGAELESKQRALLSARLEVMAADFARQQEEQAAMEAHLAELEAKQQAILQARQQPKAPADEEVLAAKYGSIECIEERAFNILVDLGLVELSTL